MATVLRAKKVVTMAGPVIENGAVAINWGSNLGSWFLERTSIARQQRDQSRRRRAVARTDQLSLPSRLHSSRRPASAAAILRAIGLEQINSARRELTAEDYLRSIANGISGSATLGHNLGGERRIHAGNPLAITAAAATDLVVCGID